MGFEKFKHLKCIKWGKGSYAFSWFLVPTQVSIEVKHHFALKIWVMGQFSNMKSQNLLCIQNLSYRDQKSNSATLFVKILGDLEKNILFHVASLHKFSSHPKIFICDSYTNQE